MQEKINQLYDDYAKGIIDRREFLKKLALLTGVACTIVPVLEANADIIAADDPRLETETISYPGDTGQVQAYLAQPKGAEKLPAVIVIHENRALQPHIKDVTRRMALEGFLA